MSEKLRLHTQLGRIGSNTIDKKDIALLMANELYEKQVRIEYLEEQWSKTIDQKTEIWLMLTSEQKDEVRLKRKEEGE